MPVPFPIPKPELVYTGSSLPEVSLPVKRFQRGTLTVPQNVRIHIGKKTNNAASK